jgi:hypothetical protein
VSQYGPAQVGSANPAAM